MMTNLFESIINISISAVWLILAAVCARALLFRAPKWTRMLLWALVAVRLILPFTVESQLSLVPKTKTVELTILQAQSPTEPIRVEMIPTEPAPITPVTPMIPSETITPHIPVTPNVPEADIDPQPITPDLPITEEKPDEEIPVIELSTNAVTVKNVEKDEPVNIGLILSVVWIAGMAVMTGYFTFSYLSLRFRLRDAVRGEGRVWYSDRIDTAFIFGIIKARIYLPFGLGGTASEHVLSHERAHLKRGDHIIKPLAFFILSLHWFNPAVWFSYILFCKDVELACDESVIQGMNSEKVSEYSHALVTLSTKGNRLSLHPISFGGANMKNRLKNILNYKKPTLWIIFAALILCVAVAVCFFTSPKKEEGSTAESTYGVNETEPSEAPTETEELPTEQYDENKEYIFRRDDAEPVTLSYRIQNTYSMSYPFECLNDVTVDIPTSKDDSDFKVYVNDAYIGEKVSDPKPKRETVITVTVTYSDGTAISSDMDYFEKDGETYKVKNLNLTYGFGRYAYQKLNEIKAGLPNEGQFDAGEYGFDSLNELFEHEDTVYTLYHAEGGEYVLTAEDYQGFHKMFDDLMITLACSAPENGKVIIRAPEGEKDAEISVYTGNIIAKAVNGSIELFAYESDAGVYEIRTPNGSHWFCSYHWLTAHNDTVNDNFTDRIIGFMVESLGDQYALKFEAENDDAAEVFFTRALPEHYLDYPFDHPYQELYSEYQLLGYEVVKEENDRLFVKGTYAFNIATECKYGTVIGGRQGEGVWRGWRYAENYPFILAKDSKGLWRIEANGSGVELKDNEDQKDKYLSEGYTKHSEGVYLKTIAGMPQKNTTVNYAGYMVLCTDPDRISTVSNDAMLKDGKLIEDVVSNTGAAVGISDIPAPTDFTADIISDGKIVKNTKKSTEYIAGITEDGNLLIEKCTAQEAVNKGIKNGCTVRKVILKDSETYPNTDLHTTTPTVIAQRQSGEIVFIIIDGRQYEYSYGCTDVNSLLRILQHENCTSAALLYSGVTNMAGTVGNKIEFLNRCHDTTVPSKNAWIIK